MGSLLKKRVSFHSVFLFFLALLFTTVFRVFFVFFFPILVLLIAYLYDFKITRSFLNLLLLVFFLWLLSFRNGLYIKYNVMGLLYFLPFLFLFLTKISQKAINRNFIRYFIAFLVFFAIVNNVIGLIQYFTNPFDDSFVGIYGAFTVTQNGLSLINSILFFYFFQSYTIRKRKIHLAASFFFLSCAVLAFYGAGLIVLFLTLILFYVRISIKGIFKLFFLIMILGSIVYFFMKAVSPNTLDYNLAIINKFWNASLRDSPRKLIVFYNYITAYPRNLLDFLFGSGPGTFNSRSAFMVGSPSYFNIGFIKSEVQPYYFKNFAYPLWNASNTGPYDGFMNQPFSSLLAILGEYGLMFTILFFGTVRKQYFEVIKILKGQGQSNEQKFAGHLYKFLMFYILLLLVIDNYMEYPEVMGLMLLLLKFAEYEIKKQA